MTRIQHLIAIVAFTFTALATARAHAGPVEVHDTFIKFQNLNYFVGGADKVGVGSYGEKKSPIGKANYLFVQDGISPSKLDGKVTSASIVSIDFANSSKADIETTVSAVKVVNTSDGVTYTHLKDGTLKLVHLTISGNDIRDAANSSSSVLSDLKSYGSDARLVTDVFVVMKATLADTVTTGTTFAVSGTINAVKISVSGGGSSSSSTDVTLSPGTIFAYGLVKLDWNSGKTKIDKVNPDQAHSLN